MSKGAQRPPRGKRLQAWWRRERTDYRQRSFMGKVAVWGLFATFLGLGVGIGAWISAPSDDDVVNRFLERGEEVRSILATRNSKVTREPLDVEFGQEIQGDPKNSEALFRRGVLLAGTGRHEQALQLFLEATLIDGHPGAYFHIGLLMAGEGVYETAEYAYKRAIDGAPPNSRLHSEAHHHLGLVHWVRGNPQRANYYLRWAMTLDRDNYAAERSWRAARRYLAREEQRERDRGRDRKEEERRKRGWW